MSITKTLLLIVFGMPGTCILPAQTIPADAGNSSGNSCPITPATFNSWFESGAPSLNGVVKPANSITFPATPNCSFYEWSKQMFLWLTSPAPANYGGGGGRILDSPTFYDVSPEDSSGQRTLVPHTPGLIRSMGVRIPKLGPNKFPVVIDKTGRMLEVRPSRFALDGRQIILDQLGNPKEIEQITISPNRKLMLQDVTGKPIQLAVSPNLSTAAASGNLASNAVQKFIVSGRPVFADLNGNVIDVEQGQADGGVLMAQNGSLVYYATMVNDVYAYFLTRLKKGRTPQNPTQFPTNQAALDSIVAFAAAHGKTFPDANALAVEVKTSWVEAAGIRDPNSYITMRATIPTYDKSNPALWVPNGQKTVDLAMVGMHVVGSTAQHPEMIWATFEHFGNTPNASYSYVNSSNANVEVPQSSAGHWLFSSSGAVGPFNEEHMLSNGVNIVPNFPASMSVSPSDTMRRHPWGMPDSSAHSNTEVISIHNNVNALMPAGDVRKNYFMVGATWTVPGVAPPNGQVGTSQLANTTMETYQQALNCLSCHTTNTTAVSRVFNALKPLF